MQIWCEPAAPDPAASAVALNSTACKMSVRTSCEADPAARGFIAVNHPVMPSGDDAALSLSSVSPVSKTVFLENAKTVFSKTIRKRSRKLWLEKARKQFEHVLENCG